ncbi:phospholipase [Pseudomonas taiwanensis]|uniref:putative bifunctional diguanylate cyclase/phosphodiesterase n=1 Tax=Pseudomonas TaxID=286 RepID=UPI0015BDC54F|nr:MULTISPECIES: EAL domain-containing protein [Pseudomonas]MDH4559706.1 EAL domain-containing protein [Pseudomonas sp. BN411]MDH4652976.1 EAL domain-containing protein [Pseudomonas sp. BN606]MDH4872553.1 EAL domain-containing protein [Pseudomonas sp. BN515]NWL78033.1 phospholipase [Pseudomonas taiwanensis]
MLLRCSNEQELLSGMCRVIVGKGYYRYAGVWSALNDDGYPLVHMAYALSSSHSLQEAEFFKSISLSWANPERGGAAAIAVITGKACVGRNLLTDPDHAKWREDMVRLGYGSVTAFPLRVDSVVVGSLCITATEPEVFDESEVSLLGELADDLAFGIENLRIRAKHQAAEKKIHQMAYYDSLTGLPNREMFYEKIKSAIIEFREKNRPLAVLLLKAKNYHEIKDTFGHIQGDKLLQEIANQLCATILSSGFVSRVGEAEFAILYPHADAECAIQMAQKLNALFHCAPDSSGLTHYTRVTIGIALFPGHGVEPDALFRHARAAMSEARRTGRDYVVFAHSLDEACTNRLLLTSDLREAIKLGQLILYCQPKFSLACSYLCGAEALVRWRHPVRGMVPPSEFVTLAEFTGLITTLTFWVLEAAFRQCFAWNESGLNIPLSINLSAQDLCDTRLVTKIEGLMATWGAKSNWIQFEVTESALMEDPANALETLRKLKGTGAQIAVDDFGIGYSSLSYLQNLPIDAIKIDQSFVKQMAEHPKAAAIVHSTIELAHRLNLEVIAEGVENQEAWERLVKMGCDVVQGYYIGAPMPAEAFGDWLEHSKWK